MKTFLYIITFSVFIAASAMAKPTAKPCRVKALAEKEFGFALDQVDLVCGSEKISANVFSETQMMLFSMAKKQDRMVKVEFAKMDKKRIAVQEVNFK